MQPLLEDPNGIWQKYYAPNPKNRAVSEHTANLNESINQKSATFEPFGDDGLSFLDILDMVNPLHHIPVIGDLYREVSGDKIDPIPRITGSSLFFGPIGFIGSAINILVEGITGKDFQSHFNSVFRSKNEPHIVSYGGTSPLDKNPPKNYSTIRKLDITPTNFVSDWAKKEISIRNAKALQIQQIGLLNYTKHAENSQLIDKEHSSLPNYIQNDRTKETAYYPHIVNGISAYEKQIAHNHKTLINYENADNSISILN